MTDAEKVRVIYARIKELGVEPEQAVDNLLCMGFTAHWRGSGKWTLTDFVASMGISVDKLFTNSVCFTQTAWNDYCYENVPLPQWPDQADARAHNSYIAALFSTIVKRKLQTTRKSVH